MKICVTAAAGSLDAAIDPRFGRCAFFIIIDPATLEFKALPNPNLESSGGAGIQSAQLVANEGVEAVVTGNVGPNAHQTLSALGIKVLIGASGTVSQAVADYRAGRLQEAAGPSVSGHFGQGGGK
ncbi:MAG: NifB/NifX family molybdenum-iron cluster-binding protein [Candidatus Saganbacteria bacterium]|nr:NifB/NifX family molybdenum-iron cluster-binding protein [Candidatus Saganbacteria bacterium]